MGSASIARVRVPASSANLGPGFDALAVALNAYLDVETSPRQEHRVVASGEGADEVPADDGNLVWRAFAAYCAWAGVPAPDVTLVTRNAVPLERGMGSSAAAAVAGVALARAVTGGGGRDADLVRIAADLEGHPDNAAAALLGGLVLCVDEVFHRFEPSSRLRPVVCVPEARQATTEARGVLPAEIPLGEAAANGARTAAVLAGLTGAMGWDPAVLSDVLHEPSRLALMADSGRLVAALREAGVGACLSGAGPSVLAVLVAGDESAVGTVREFAGDGWRVLPLDWDRAGAFTQPSPVSPAGGGGLR